MNKQGRHFSSGSGQVHIYREKRGISGYGAGRWNNKDFSEHEQQKWKSRVDKSFAVHERYQKR